MPRGQRVLSYRLSVPPRQKERRLLHRIAGLFELSFADRLAGSPRVLATGASIASVLSDVACKAWQARDMLPANPGVGTGIYRL